MANSNSLLQFVKALLNSFKNVLLGLCVLFMALLYVIFFTPMFLYRWIITKHLAQRYRPSIGNAVTVAGHFMATEFMDNNGQNVTEQTRGAIVCTATFQGILSLAVLTQVITEGWLSVKEGESELRYPEFQQYLELWMGFMFWKPVEKFSLDNHVQVHRIPENSSKENSEKILCSLVETMANKKFPAGQSPWEVNLIHNYRNLDLCKENDGGVMTVLMFRFHHALVDGFSVMYALIDGLGIQKLPHLKIPTPKVNAASVILRLTRTLCLPWTGLQDLGYFGSLMWRYGGDSSTPWHAPDSKKMWKQLYGRSGLIPVKKIKFIKDQAGVTFTSVLLSCLAAGAAKHFRKKKFAGKTNPICTAVPLPGHPNKLRNHSSATFLELNVSPNMDPVERLRKTEEIFQKSRHSSLLPLITSTCASLMSFPVAPVSRFLCKNRLCGTGLSNFPGPGVQIELKERKCLALDFCVGGLNGVAGVVFSVLSYVDHVRVSVLAENGIMERKELEELISNIEQEMDLLYERAVAIKEYKVSSDGVADEPLFHNIV